MTTAARAGLLHEQRLPGESDEYRLARDELLRAEIELKRQTERVAAKRRDLPPGGALPQDYTFQEWDAAVGHPRAVRFSELFADKDTLVAYSFMFKPRDTDPLGVPCPICTSIIDGIDGELPHIAQRTSFVVIAKAPIEQFGAHARAREWRHSRLLSSAGTSYNRDYHAEAPDGEQFAMVNTFVRHDATIRHFWSSEEWHVPPEPSQNPRHVDFMWPLWGVLDRTREGRGTDWMPRLSYHSNQHPGRGS
jgi:predicted dithiol-disulfide oxidoreductase (DUF899 family)